MQTRCILLDILVHVHFRVCVLIHLKLRWSILVLSIPWIKIKNPQKFIHLEAECFCDLIYEHQYWSNRDTYDRVFKTTIPQWNMPGQGVRREEDAGRIDGMERPHGASVSLKHQWLGVGGRVDEAHGRVAGTGGRLSGKLNFWYWN